MKTSAGEIEKVRNLLKDFPTAILVTHDGPESLRARPRAVAEVDAFCDLWFMSYQRSAKVEEIRNDEHVHIVCQRENTAFLSISGKATLVRDRARIEEVWKEPFRVWFPDGKDDPHLVLIHVVPERAEYWDNRGLNKASYLWESAIAYVSGETPRVREGEQHGVVELA
jgi:general stress protein 26